MSEPGSQDIPPTPEPPADTAAPNGTSGANGTPADTLASAWTQLKKQQTDFERRSEVLDALRQRLTRHLDKQNRVILERQRALDTRRLQSERELQFLSDAKLHLRRTQKEEEARQQRLEQRARQLADDEATVEMERTEVERARQAHERAHTSKLTALLHEKQAAEARAHTLEQHLDTAPRRRLLSDWRLGTALLVGCIAAGTLLVSGHFDYESWVRVSATSARMTGSDMQAHRSGLARDLAVKATDPASPLHAPVVSLDADDRLQARAHSMTRDGADGTLRCWVSDYLTAVETARLQRIAATRQTIDALGADVSSTEDALATLVGRIADQRLEIQVENPKAEWQKLNADVEAARQAIGEVRGAADAARTRLAELERTTIPEAPEVPADIRVAAEKDDAQLHQDLEELRFHLNRLRNHLLEAFAEFPQQLERLSATTQDFSTRLETARVQMDDATVTAHLESIWQLARKLADRVLEFDYAWRKQSDALQRLSVDPRRDDCQTIQRTVEKLVRDLNDDVNRLLGDVQVEHQRYLRSLDSRGQHFELTSGLRRGLEAILEQQYAFTALAGRVLPSGNLALDTIMHRVDGLSRRAADRRTAIEGQLAEDQRQRLAAEHEAALIAVRDDIRRLEGRRRAATDELLSLLERLNALTPYVEEHGITDTVLRYTQDEADALAGRVETLKRDRRAAEARLSELLAAEKPLTIDGAGVGRWPVNLATRGLHVGSTAIAAALLCYLILTTLTRPRQRAGHAGPLHRADHGAS